MQNRKQPRILLVIPNLGRGGAQKVFLDQLDFYSLHFETIGCVFNWNDSFPSDQRSNIVSLDVPAGNNFFQKIFFFLKRIRRLRQIKKKYRIDFSISHLEGADYVNVISGYSGKIFCWIHGTKTGDQNISGLIGWIRKRILIPLIYDKCNLVITVSKGIRNELISEFRLKESRIKTIYNAFDLTEIGNKSSVPLKKEVDLLFGPTPILITHCRFAKQKNLSSLLRIFHSIKKIVKCKLIILGDGEERATLLELCEDLALSNYNVWGSLKFSEVCDVYFFGHQVNPYAFLTRAKLYISTSLWEGFPLSLGEAMICGLPVISSDCMTGPREIMNIELGDPAPVSSPYFTPYGILMPLTDSPQSLSLWAQTIINLLKDESAVQQMRNKGKSRMAAYDRGTVTLQWLEIINEAYNTNN